MSAQHSTAPRPAWRDAGLKRAGFPAWLAGSGVLIAAALSLPLVYLLMRALSYDRALAVLQRDSTWHVLVGSTALAITTAAASVLVAVPLAWLTERSDLPGRRVWRILSVVPLVIPSYLGSFALIAVLGPRGTAQQLLAPLGVERLPEIYGFGGAALALTLFGYPYVLITVRSALRRGDPALEEAARALGDRPWQAFMHVSLPQVRPAIAAGALLVALYTLSDFGAVSLMQYDALTRVIFVHYRASFNREAAAVLGLLLVAVTLVIILAESWTRGAARYYRAGAGAVRQHPPVALGRWRWPALLYCTLVVGLAVVLPLGAMSGWVITAALYGTLVVDSLVQQTVNSVLVSLGAALACVIAALPIVLLSVRHPHWLSRALERLSYVGYALPGIVIALALVHFGARYLPALYQTFAMLVFGYVVRFVPEAVGALRSRMLQLNPRFEEAARMLGDDAPRAFGRITTPLLAPGFIAGGALVFLTTMKELPLTLLLAPNGFATLATEIWSASSEALFAHAAAPSLVLVAVSILSLRLLLRES